MLRFALLTGALVSLTGLAQAAELGQLAVQSRFGEPLSARLLVRDVDPNVHPLTVHFAPAERYAQVGQQPPPSDLGLSLEIESKEPWSVRISSRAPLRQDELPLIIELSEAGQRSAKLYRVRPLTTGAAPAPAPAPERSVARATLPSVSERPTQAAAPRPAAEPKPTPEPKPAARPAPRPAPQPAARPAERPAAGSMVTAEPGLTGWSLAKRYADLYPDATIDQILVAFVRANPDAFVGQATGGLRSGARLRLPDPAAPRAVPRPRAYFLVHRDPRANAMTDRDPRASAPRERPTPPARTAPAPAPKPQESAPPPAQPAPAPAPEPPAPAPQAAPEPAPAPQPAPAPAAEPPAPAPEPPAPAPQAAPEPAPAPQPAPAPEPPAVAPAAAPAPQPAPAPAADSGGRIWWWLSAALVLLLALGVAWWHRASLAKAFRHGDAAAPAPVGQPEPTTEAAPAAEPPASFSLSGEGRDKRIEPVLGDAARVVDAGQAERLINEARRQIGSGQALAARDLLRQAEALANEAQKITIARLLDSIRLA